jgi:SAM-dependent methyltransferase
VSPMRTSSAPSCLEPHQPRQAVTALESGFEAQSPPGTNLKGAVGAANWCFLLPSLDLGRVLSLGRPSWASLFTLSKLAAELAVWAKPGEHERLQGLIARQDLRNVTLLSAGTDSLPVSDDDVDVVLVAKPGLVRSQLGGARAQAELKRVLKPGGLLYAESYPWVERWLRRPSPEPLFDQLGGRSPLWIAPAFDEMRFAAPSDAREAVEYLDRRFLRPIFRRELVKHPRRVLARSTFLTRSVRRRGVFVSGAGDEAMNGPPAYIRAIAASADADVEGLRWALAAPGDYSSQKVLLFLFKEQGGQPQSVVKITRDARYNARLANEWRALTLLEERGIGQDGTCPSPLFLGHEAGLAVLGETALTGVPFLRQLKAGSQWQQAQKAVEWLGTLGAATSHRPANAPIVVARLQAALDRFDELYRPPRDTSRFLAEQVAAIAAGGDGMSLVFQHGDPGPWNLLVTPEGRPAFLDWEAADTDGMPLWDLFHFLRSFGFAVSKKTGTHDHVRSFAEQVLAASELNDVLVETSARYCDEASLSPRLVEPLFYLCWMHRAVKEASRLPNDRLQRGRYVNFLSLAVERRDAPGLQRLFSIPAVT